jgi:RNA polymerase sigma-70 factor, ECF subfamily
LRTLYLVFNEGYLAAEGDALVRHRLVEDALELAETVVDLLPWHAEAQALLALMLLHASRREARVDAHGAMVTLELQDRTRWDREQIARGTTVLDRAMTLRAAGGGLGVYQVHAAIASLHCNASRAEETDWVQIAALYRLLLTLQPSPVVELNAAVALMMSGQPKDALAWVNSLEKRRVLGDYHLLAAVKAQLLEKLGHPRQANRYYRRARKLTANQHERALLSPRIAATDGPASTCGVRERCSAIVVPSTRGEPRRWDGRTGGRSTPRSDRCR